MHKISRWNNVRFARTVSSMGVSTVATLDGHEEIDAMRDAGRAYKALR